VDHPSPAGLTKQFSGAGVKISHRGGETLQQQDIEIRVEAERGRETHRGYGIGVDRSSQTTDPLWNTPERGRIQIPASTTVRLYLVPDRRIGTQPTTALARGDATCGVADSDRSGRITFTDRPHGTDACRIDGRRRPPRTTADALASGDTVRVVWSPPGSDRSQVLREVTVP
jgi:hypothetical protein